MGLIVPRGQTTTLYESNAQATPDVSTLGTAVSNPAGAAHTKNTSWTQLIASSAFDTSLVVIHIMTSTAAATDTSVLLDIGIGAAAAETTIIPNLLAGHAASLNGNGARHYIFPLYIPAGSRISARTQSVRTTGGVTVFIELFGGAGSVGQNWVGQEVTAYGINTADSGGTAVTAGNSGAEGTVVSIGTTSRNHEALVIGCGGTNGTTVYNALAYYFDVGIDTASTAWLVRDYYYLQTATNEAMQQTTKVTLPIYASIPSGTVLAMGGECSGTAQAIDFALYGVS
jgi:hypothetical protein